MDFDTIITYTLLACWLRYQVDRNDAYFWWDRSKPHWVFR